MNFYEHGAECYQHPTPQSTKGKSHEPRRQQNFTTKKAKAKGGDGGWTLILKTSKDIFHRR
jgi:hypothetical protein